jgi:uncharacterized metal-binding protein
MAKETTMKQPNDLPLVYSCSGCSSAAQMANDLAIRLHRDGDAEMSCIAGVGGGVKPLVRIAKSGRKVLAIDGCKLHCVKSCLTKHGVGADAHFDLSDLGVRKQRLETYEPSQAKDAYGLILEARLRHRRTCPGARAGSLDAGWLLWSYSDLAHALGSHTRCSVLRAAIC